FVVEIIDSGVGISPDAVARIFRPFEQAADGQNGRRFGGLGLGLSITKAILDRHGAEIVVNSRGLGQGATFRVELPMTNTLVPMSVGNGSGASKSAGGTDHIELTQTPLRVLLVED